MAKIKPFKGVRPTPEKIMEIASPPYDVLNSQEAREVVKTRPNSFLHVVKPEVDLPVEIDHYDEKVYLKGKENLNKLIADKMLIQDEKDCYYLYQQIMNEHKQLGLVVGASIEDYENNIIKKHEHTRAKKEADRIKHVDTLNANTGPVFLTYPAVQKIDDFFAESIKATPDYDFISEDGIKHTFWKIDDDAQIEKITKMFTDIKYLYVADGHHRSASGTMVGQQRRKANKNHTGNEEYNYFLSVIFPHNQLYVMDYNRVVKDLNGLSKDEFFKKVEKKFDIKENPTGAYHPTGLHNFGMYIDKKWYNITAKDGSFAANDPVKSLDVAILQDNLLHPILAIGDPRKDERIDFVGGISGL
ncbi:MAG: DUF1015 domain-containing protein, partial [Candidatus Cloacimonadota bacterium]|nr:DUF1015 domain-containing protein [Candidatus Cloacimonadota bacterium]